MQLAVMFGKKVYIGMMSTYKKCLPRSSSCECVTYVVGREIAIISWHQKNDIDSSKNIHLIDVRLLACEHRRISGGYFFPLKKYM